MGESDIERRLTSIEGTQREIFNLLNGAEGIVTKVELHHQIIGNIPSPASLKWYAFAGGGVITFVSLLGFCVAKVVSKIID